LVTYYDVPVVVRLHVQDTYMYKGGERGLVYSTVEAAVVDFSEDI
jgi:hypothetical protein